jgi:methylated-DNA-protein-cysteine methyltransferase-like protein
MTASERIIEIIKAIPAGKVMGYGEIAKLAGCPNGARTVARILHSSSEKHNLPWWRVVRSSGEIALSMQSGGALQKELLLGEGVKFVSNKAIDKNCIIRGD